MKSAQRDQLIANWVRDATGPYGYEGFLSLGATAVPTVTAGASSMALEPYAGAFFRLGPTTTTVDYPGSQGPHIQYVGIDATGIVDLVPPFNVQGGTLLVYNASGDITDWIPEHSGPDLPAVLPGALPPSPPPPGGPRRVHLAWLNPPPINPERLGALRTWRYHTLRRLAREGWTVPAR